MTSTKMVLLAFAFTGLSVVIGGSTASYVGYRKAQEKLGVSGGDIGRTFSTFANFEETLADIAGSEGGEFGKRAAELSEQHPFQRPDNGALSEQQVRSFIAVKDALGTVDAEMAADAQKEKSQEPGVAFLAKWNFFTRMQRLRMVQIAELERQQMTVEEYNWVHFEIYKALVADGMLKTNDSSDWGKEMGASLDRSTKAIDDELANSETTAERRRELEQIRARITEGRDVLTGAAEGFQDELRSIPAESRRLVEQYKTELARSFMSAIDLDSIDVMKGMESAKAQ